MLLTCSRALLFLLPLFNASQFCARPNRRHLTNVRRRGGRDGKIIIIFFLFCDVCECCSSFLETPPPLSVSPFHPYFRGINLLPGGRGGLQRATSCLLPSGFAESNAKIFIKGCNLSSMEGGEVGRENWVGYFFQFSFSPLRLIFWLVGC